MFSKKSFFKKNKSFIIFIIFLICLLFTRFYGLNWGNSFFFHPDENRDAVALSQMNLKNLNPDFYAYGQFPLLLSFFSFQFGNFLINHSFITNLSFEQSIYILRFWSAIFSCLSIWFLYLISKNIFNKKSSQLIFIILLIFNPGLIQFAHFGTNESILIFVFIVNIFFSFKIVKNCKPFYIITAAIISGIGIASKISAIILLGPVFLSFLFNFISSKKIKFFLINCFLFCALTLTFSLLFSPQYLIKKTEFLYSLNYELSVSTGKNKVYYTNQFLNSIPYFFQIKNIFPYTSGVFVFIFSGLGFFYFLKNKKYKNIFWLLILIPSLVYFLYNGQLYTKWTRYMVPIFFIFPFLATYFISQFKTKYIIFILVLLSIIPGIYFCRRYFLVDNRPIASVWLINQIPSTSSILSESGNVMNLPVYSSNLQINNFDFYNLDSNPNLPSQLTTQISKSEYIIIPSRRMFKNQNNSTFPFSQKYYQSLFSGQLGFTQIRQFNYHLSLFLNDENAEETWSVFDNPTIRIYKKD